MNKNEFLTILETSLFNLSFEEKKDIIYDYEEHFRIGEENGKSEDELIKELGDPQSIAKQYQITQTNNFAQSQPSAKNISNTVCMGIILGLFNLIFILGPYLGIIGVIIGLFAAAAGAAIAGVGMLLAIVLAPVIPQFVSVPSGILAVATAFYGVGTVALGILFFVGVCYVAKYFYIGTIKYLKWNMNIIRK